MLKKLLIAFTAVSCQSLGIVTEVASTSGAAGTVLTEESNTGVTFTNNFNPFNGQSFATEMNARSLIFEPLYEVNYLKANTNYPWLATGYSWGSAGKSITFTLRTGVKFSDGSSFGPADVAYTFDIFRQFADANYAGVPAQSQAPTTSANTVTLYFSAPAYQSFSSVAGTALMVKSGEFGSTDPGTTTLAGASAVGTGPYTQVNFSTQIVKFAQNPNYWDLSHLAASEVDIPSEASNTNAATDLANGTLDWAGNDIANVNQVFVSKNPATNHTFFAAGNTVTLTFNVKYGFLSDPKVRAAISAGINRQALATKGESGYEKPATSSSGLILPNQKAYLTKASTNDLKPSAQPATVKSILRSDGFKKVGRWWEKNGKKIQFQVEDPSNYTDYYADAQLIQTELQAVGIDATADGVQDTKWYSDLAAGTFQSAIHWGNGGASPYVQYSAWFDYNQFVKKTPTNAGNDFGRFYSAAAEKDLATLVSTAPSNTKAVTAATQALGQIMTKQVPYAPLLYGADWDVYSTARFTGWPTASNPYIDPSPNDPELPDLLTHITAVG